MNTKTIKKPNSLLGIEDFTFINKALCVVVGCALLTISSYIEIPMIPVPMTMQTYAVLMIACLFGFRLGLTTVLLWLGLSALGLPLLAGGTGGIIKFIGPTAGYLIGFIAATAFIGYFKERGINKHKPFLMFVFLFIGTKFILALGYAWLGYQIGWEQAWVSGVLPFLFGDFVKVCLAFATITGIQLFHRQKD